MQRISTTTLVGDRTAPLSGISLAALCDRVIFLSLLGLVVITAVPYGTVEPWWRAAFVCAVFALCVPALIERLSSGSKSIAGMAMLAPMIALVAFAILQTIPLSWQVNAVSNSARAPISADSYGTQFFAVQLLALTLAAALLYRYASTERRIRILIHVVIAVVVVSAIYGILRQTTQHSVGFLLPLIRPDRGYGQFVNANHFAFLMEMGFGLALGMIVGGGVKREKTLLYFAALLPIWTALVLSNSRGGLLAMMLQLTAGGLLFTVVVPVSRSHIAGLRGLRAFRSLPVRALLLLVILGAVIVGTVWIGGDRLVGKIDDAQRVQDTAGVSRYEIWRATWKMFQAHPIAGVGMGGYWIGIHQHHEASGVFAPQEAHNDYLEALASGGIIGAILLLWFVVTLLRRVRTNLRSANQFQRAACFGATLGIVGVGFHSLFDFGLHMLANALICIALVVVATNKFGEGQEP